MDKRTNFTHSWWNSPKRRTRVRTPARASRPGSCESLFPYSPRRFQMSIWRPDPTFYPSPKMPTQEPPEKLSSVGMLNGNTTNGRDALGAVDVDPESSGYGNIVGQVDMPKDGDDVHHLGWNACSARLCAHAPHPHVERRYLIVPGINASRIH